MANVIVSCEPWHGRTVKSLELCLEERPVGLGTDSLGGYGLAFLLLFGLLLCLHGCIILGHVDDIDMLPGANGLQQAEESRSRILSKERLQAVKHHSSVAVTQLKPESRDGYCGHEIICSLRRKVACSFVGAFTGAAIGSADLLGLDENPIQLPFHLLDSRGCN